MDMTPVTRRFVLHWGEMGTRWGVNRTVAQTHALLFLADQPLCADDVVDALGVARSNVSTSLRELQGWGIVRLVHVLGDRRDHFETITDPWELFQVILDERKKREVDPTLEFLRQCVADAEHSSREPKHVRRRLRAMLGFFETMTGWYDQIRGLSTGAVRKFVKLGGKVHQLVAH